ncbi:MAG: hypothetical protein OEV43_02470 [Coriobacteriia bacterium]|nr:hypothetical protein [Coriobacteriia bacterium]
MKLRADKGPSSAYDPALEHPERKIGPEGVWYGLLALVCLTVFAAAIIATASVSPRFCGLCHASASASLHDSPHSAVGCDSCHVERGTLGLVENRLGVVSMVLRAPFVWVSGSSAVGGAPFDSKRCLECHESLETGIVEVGGIKMSHRAPIEANWLCVECHQGSSHPGATYVGASYSMEKCLECHSTGTENLASCSICHLESGSREERPQTAWQATHGSNWRTTHGMGTLSTCRACHAKDYCVACHNLPLPHPANFMSSHGSLVLARETGVEDCSVCHEQSVCGNCHGLEMPHPDYFVQTHSTEVESNGSEVCDRCHTEQSCTECHTRHAHPGLPPEQREILRRNPVSAK